MTLPSYVSDDIFLHIPSTAPSPSSSKSQNPPPHQAHQQKRNLIFFIPGNPGLISYYHTFLRLLSQQTQTCQSTNLDAVLSPSYTATAGFSLGGFEKSWVSSPSTSPINTAAGSVDESGTKFDLRHIQVPINQEKALYGLLDQIELCYARIEALVARLSVQFDVDGRSTEREVDSGINIILIGHSVGAYIALEVIRLWNERSSGPPRWTPIAALLLTPTIIDIHKSPSGQLATPLLSTIPFLPEVLQLATTALRFGLPHPWLKAVVAKITGMAPGFGLETTMQFLLSPKGVKQSLHLARDELSLIRADKWGSEVWGVCNVNSAKSQNQSSTSSPDLYFLFAGKDHWVADSTREEIVQSRRGDERKVLVDSGSEGLVHAWCLRQSEPVAKRVMGWLRELVDHDARTNGGRDPRDEGLLER